MEVFTGTLSKVVHTYWGERALFLLCVLKILIYLKCRVPGTEEGSEFFHSLVPAPVATMARSGPAWHLESETLGRIATWVAETRSRATICCLPRCRSKRRDGRLGHCDCSSHSKRQSHMGCLYPKGWLNPLNPSYFLLKTTSWIVWDALIKVGISLVSKETLYVWKVSVFQALFIEREDILKLTSKR